MAGVIMKGRRRYIPTKTCGECPMFHYPSVIVGGNGVLFDGDVIGECIFIGHVTRSAKDPICRARHSFETLRNHIDFLNFKILMLSSKLKAKDIIIRDMEEEMQRLRRESND